MISAQFTHPLVTLLVKLKGDYMTKYNVSDIFKIVGIVVLWAIAALIGFTVFTTVAEIIIAFAGTGVGAVVLAVCALFCWKKYMKNNR